MRPSHKAEDDGGPYEGRRGRVAHSHLQQDEINRQGRLLGLCALVRPVREVLQAGEVDRATPAAYQSERDGRGSHDRHLRALYCIRWAAEVPLPSFDQMGGFSSSPLIPTSFCLCSVVG